MEKKMITYAREELVGITDLGKSLGNYLDKVSANILNRITIVRRNKPEAVVLPIEEYERLQSVYDQLEQEEIEALLRNMSDEDKQIAKTKTLMIDV